MGMISSAPQSAQQVLIVRGKRKTVSAKNGMSHAMSMSGAIVSKRKALGRRVPAKKRSS